MDIPLTQNTLISGQYKILTGNVDLAGWTGPVYPNTTKPSGISAIEHCGDSGCLYNIIDDPEEYTNLAEKMPDVLKEMQAKLVKYQATRFTPDRGSVSSAACVAALNVYHGFWGAFCSLKCNTVPWLHACKDIAISLAIITDYSE